MSVRYGEIYYYDFGENDGSVQGGFRPVLVVQNDDVNEKSPTTVVAAITSQNKRLDLKTHIRLGKSSGLKKPSTVMLEQIKTVNQEDLTDYVGIVESNYLLKKLRNATKSEFGMFVHHSDDNEYVRYICPDCLSRLKKRDGENKPSCKK